MLDTTYKHCGVVGPMALGKGKKKPSMRPVIFEQHSLT